jgi:hypothetical protein
MMRNQWTLIVVAILLGGLSVYLNKDWFAKDHIQIYDRSRPARAFPGQPSAQVADIDPIVFGFDRKLRLTLLKIVPLEDLETNKYPHAVWHLVSESNSVPIKDFNYGQHIPGMHPALKGSAPDPLAPGVKYRLFIEAGAFKGQHDFATNPRT